MTNIIMSYETMRVENQENQHLSTHPASFENDCGEGNIYLWIENLGPPVASKSF